MNSELYRLLMPHPAKHKRTDVDATINFRGVGAREGASQIMRLNDTPGLQQPSLISSYEGTISRLLFSFPPYGLADEKFRNAYKSLIRELRSGTKFLVVCLEADRPKIERWFIDASHEIDAIEWAYLPPFTSFTDWAEDAYVAVTDATDGQHYLVEPWHFPRGGDALIADAVEEFTPDIRATQSPLMFQGGNCIIADEHWFLGRDYFFDCIDLLREGRPPVLVPDGTSVDETVYSLFRQYLDSDRKLELLGSQTPSRLPEIVGTKSQGRYFLELPRNGTGTFQPIFHIDMLLTIIGDGEEGLEVMVGDPTLADELLNTESPVAQPEQYDLIAHQIESLGIKVHRNPLVHWPREGGTATLTQFEDFGAQNSDRVLLDACDALRELGAVDNSDVTGREWHHITWNNCLVENSNEVGKHVYLPTFGHGNYISLNVLDEFTKEIWEGLGFEVHMLGDFNAFAERSGVVHCISKFIGRNNVENTG